jgi:hypothetical protein
MGGRHQTAKGTDPMMGVVVLITLLILATVIVLALAGY